MSLDPEERAAALIVEAVRTQQTTLMLAGLGLTQLPRGVEWLFQLRFLYLGGNQISSLPANIGLLIHLEYLDLADNLLTDLPKSIGQLTRLTTLRLSHNRLKTLPEEIGHLRLLSTLRLHNNQLVELPESLGQLTKLTELRLTGNRLRTLPESIGQMTGLTSLDLSKNSLVKLPESLGDLRSLRWLYADDNQLQSIPESLCKIIYFESLFLHGNPALNLPPEILGKTWEDIAGRRTDARPADILSYYFQTRHQPARPLNEVKLVLVGRGGAGKSSICDRLLFGSFDPQKPETAGIDIRHWSLPVDAQTFHIHVWDFAGQEVTHATHQFFLTERTIYLLVLDGRADLQEPDAEYWLRLIDGFASGCPVIVLLNQWDKHPFAVDELALRERYTAIRAFLRTDCETGRGLADLQQSLMALLLRWEQVREPFPASWWNVKERLTETKENYLPFADYRRICAEGGVDKPEEQAQLARILHALGVILHYGDDRRLRETAVLNPHWVTSGVYTLLRLKAQPGTKGVLSLDEAVAALPGESREMVAYLLSLMRRFELCYPLDEEETRWLVPEMLDPFQPELGPEWKASGAVRLRFTYKVLPPGLLPRFIVRTYPLGQNGCRWRNGVVLKLEAGGDGKSGAQALIRAELSSNRVSIGVVGEAKPRLDLIKILRGHFAHIHADWRGLEPAEEIEVTDHPGRYKNVRILEQNAKSGAVTTVDTDVGSVTINASRELARISSPVPRDAARRPVKLFISYSHGDATLLEFLKVNLDLLQQDGLISWFYDAPIRPSSEWETEIRRELDEAEIIILMVSTSFLSRPYIRGVELGRAIQRKEAGEAELLILVLEPQCSWKTKRVVKQVPGGPAGSVPAQEEVAVELGKYQVLLPKNPDVERWPLRQSAFNHVDAALRELIEHVAATRAARHPE